MRIRLRPAHTPETLAAMYAEPWTAADATPDHRLRIDTTIALGRWITDDVSLIVDLSCGDGLIAQEIARPRGSLSVLLLGDIAPGWRYHGPIERTIDELAWTAGLFICSETLEHLDDPDTVLAKIRAKTRYLLASTPIGEWNPEHNPEHYWGWDVDDFGHMLHEAGFERIAMTLVYTPPPYLYDYQIWLCQ